MGSSVIRKFSAEPRPRVLEADSKDLVDLRIRRFRYPDRETRRNGNGRREFFVRRAENQNPRESGFRLIARNADEDFNSTPLDHLLAPEFPYIVVTGHA